MFKVGDIVVCIHIPYGKDVTIGKKYEVKFSNYSFVSIFMILIFIVNIKQVVSYH